MSYGLLYEMNFSSSRCTRSASISLRFRSSASYIYSRIFSGPDPRGTYFSASCVKYTLSVALKFSPSDSECPRSSEVSREDEE
jgi:hypothetical protein